MYNPFHTNCKTMRKWLSGRASPCQGEGRGFESRLALLFIKAVKREFGIFYYKKVYWGAFSMGEIIRHDVNEEWAHSSVIEAGNLVFVGYCVGNVGQSIENQINGAFDDLIARLQIVGLDLESVVQMDALFRDVWNIPIMEKIIKEKFNGKYPVRKSIQTEFAHRGGEEGLLFQLDAIAYKNLQQ